MHVNQYGERKYDRKSFIKFELCKVYLGGRTEPEQRSEAEKLLDLENNDIDYFVKGYKNMQKTLDKAFPNEDIGITVEVLKDKVHAAYDSYKIYTALQVTAKSLRTIDRPGAKLFKPDETILKQQVVLDARIDGKDNFSFFARSVSDRIDNVSKEKKKQETTTKERQEALQNLLDRLA